MQSHSQNFQDQLVTCILRLLINGESCLNQASIHPTNSQIQFGSASNSCKSPLIYPRGAEKYIVQPFPGVDFISHLTSKYPRPSGSIE